MKKWSDGVMEYWDNSIDSIIAFLEHSNSPGVTDYG